MTCLGVKREHVACLLVGVEHPVITECPYVCMLSRPRDKFKMVIFLVLENFLLCCKSEPCNNAKSPLIVHKYTIKKEVI
jgi:hypothetical protein